MGLHINTAKFSSYNSDMVQDRDTFPTVQIYINMRLYVMFHIVPLLMIVEGFEGTFLNPQFVGEC